MNILTSIFFIIGFFLLTKGADFLVRGAASLAKKLNLSKRAIGLTVVSFGTTMPEFLVNTFSSVTGHSPIALGNVLGTNIANTLLILGIAAVIRPISVAKKTIFREIPANLFMVIAVLLLLSDTWFGGAENSLSKLEGLLLIFLFLGFLFTTLTGKTAIHTTESVEELSLSKSFGFVFVGFIFLALGTDWVIQGAIAIAKFIGWSESVIGLTVIAVGTSLPELATAINASRHKNSEIIIGNVIGSNIFNLCWILGISATLSPIPLGPFLGVSAIFAPIATLALLLAVIHGRKRRMLEKKEGAIFLALYALFLFLLFSTGR